MVFYNKSRDNFNFQSEVTVLTSGDLNIPNTELAYIKILDNPYIFSP